MRGSKTVTGIQAFLNPGWIITALLVIAFSYAAFTILSPWQLNKDAQIVARNELIEQAFEVEPGAYADIYDATGTIKDDAEWMRAKLTGQYLPDKEVILRLRPVANTPAYHALTPFQLDSGEIIVVNRGFEPFVAGEELVMPAAPQGTQTIIVHARKNEALPNTAPMTTTQPVQVYGINTKQIGELTQLKLATDYAQLAEGQPGEVHFIPIPKLDRGNHLSYGFQWIAFGIMAPLGLGYFVWSESRERRRAREEEELMETMETAAGGEPDPHEQQNLKMRSRYGNQHKNYFKKNS